VTMQEAEHLLLLAHLSVQDELKLTGPQRSEIWKLAGALAREKFNFGSNKSVAERRKQLLAVSRSSERAARKLLTRAQRQRLRQVALQTKGMLAFREPQVLTALQLTAGQRQRIREIEDESFRAMFRGPGPGRGPPPGQVGPPGGKPPARPKAAEYVQRCLDLLTPAQKQRWQQLTGNPFEFKFNPPPFRPKKPMENRP